MICLGINMIDMIDMAISESTPGWQSIVNAGGIDVIDDYPTTYVYKLVIDDSPPIIVAYCLTNLCFGVNNQASLYFRING